MSSKIKEQVNSQLQAYIIMSENDPVRFTPFFATMVNIYMSLNEDELKQLESSISLLFLRTPSVAELYKVIDKIDLQGIIQKLRKQMKSRSYNKFFSRVKSLLAEYSSTNGPSLTDEVITNVIQACLTNYDEMETILPILRRLLSNKELLFAVIDLKDEDKLRDKLIDEELIKKYIETTFPSIEQETDHLSVLNNYQLNDSITIYLNEINKLLKSPGITIEHVKNISDLLATTIGNQLNNAKLDGTGLQHLDSVFESINSFYQSNEHYKKELLVTMIYLEEFSSNNVHSERVGQLISQFITQSNSNDEIVQILNTSQVLSTYQTIISSSLITKITANPLSEDVFKLIEYVDDDSKKNILVDITQRSINTTDMNDYAALIEVLNKLYKSTDTTELKGFIQDRVFESLKSKREQFPDLVNQFCNYNKYHFINPHQRKELKSKEV